MLNYTSKTECGIVIATYGGSAAYISTSGDEGYNLDVRLPDNWNSLWGCDRNLGATDFYLPISQRTIQALAHEYTHKHVFALSQTGLVLNGMRRILSQRFLASSNDQSVRDYYRMRTIHLMETISYHETVAHRIDDIIQASEPDIDAALKQVTDEFMGEYILPAEIRIREKWKENGILPGTLAEKIFFIMGKRLHKHFSIQHSTSSGDSEYAPIISNTSEVKFYSGDAKMPWYAAPFKKVHSSFNKLAKKKEHVHKLFEWYWIGQRTQFEVLRDMYGFDMDTFKSRILIPNLFFVLEWADIPAEQHEPLFRMYEDTLTMDQDQFLEHWVPQHESYPNLKRFFEFFFRHGN